MTFTELMDRGFLLYYLEGVEVQSIAVIYVLIILGVLVCITAPYFLGSLNFAVILSNKFYHDDIRKYGSGNAGMTNMLRTYGKKAAVLTFAGDALKAFVAAMIGRMVLGEMGAYIAGFMCILGHVYPIYYKFKGGKGVVTTAVMILMLDPVIFLVLLVIFALIVLMTKYISLGSIMCMMLYPVILNRMRGPSFSNVIAIMIAAFIIFLHRTNIKRLMDGTESKISLGRKKKKESAEEEATEEEEPPGPGAGKFNKNTSKKKHKKKQRK